MSNIWADTFSAIREPHLSEEKKEKEEKGEKKHKEGPAEEKAEKNDEKEDDKPKKWWDDDGDGVGYEKGEVSGKFSKKKVNKEEVEKLDEISQKTATRAFAHRATGEYEYDTNPSDQTKSGKYKSDVARERIKNKFGKKAAQHADRAAHAQIFGRRGAGGMPPINKEERELHSKNDSNDKIDVRKGIRNRVNTKPTVSEELEAWIGELLEEGYDLSKFTLEEVAAIYESAEVEHLDEALTGERYTKVMKKPGGTAYSRRVSADPEKRATRGGRGGQSDFGDGDRGSGNRAARRAGTYGEEFELDETDTYGMPPKGDAERQKADPMAAAKARAARAKVAKEKAETLVAQQAQRLKVPTESVLSYVSGRTPLFEARFDPKKSKLRPASERAKNAMTDAERAAQKKEQERVSAIHSKGETVLVGLTSSGKKGKVKTSPEPKAPAPAANRTVKGKYDKLGKAADAVLKNLKDK